MNKLLITFGETTNIKDVKKAISDIMLLVLKDPQKEFGIKEINGDENA